MTGFAVDYAALRDFAADLHEDADRAAGAARYAAEHLDISIGEGRGAFEALMFVHNELSAAVKHAQQRLRDICDAGGTELSRVVRYYELTDNAAAADAAMPDPQRVDPFLSEPSIPESDKPEPFHVRG